MVEMQMGKNDIADLSLRAQRKVIRDRAGVNQQAVVHQEPTGIAGSQSAIARKQPVRSVTTQYVKFHAV
jgi:hypothetical protein